MIDSLQTRDRQNKDNNNMVESIQHKRIRTGSISGRLRTASELEECGYIDKTQKGIIKDLIIHGDQTLQNALDKYESGDTKELTELIRRGIFNRSNSIDILDNLDFDFLNVNNKPERYVHNNDDIMSFDQFNEDPTNYDSDFSYLNLFQHSNRSGSIGDVFPSHIFNEEFEKERVVGGTARPRNSSLDSTISTSSFKIFDYLNHMQPFDEQENLLMNDFSMKPLYGTTNMNNNGNRVVNNYSRNDNNIDMSAYEAVARTLQSNNKPILINSNNQPTTTININSRVHPNGQMSNGMNVTNKPNQPIIISTTQSNITLLKDKPPSQMPVLGPQFSHVISGPSVGVPSVTRHSENPDNKGVVGAYTIDQRKKRIDKFLEKRSRRVWTKKVKYDVRKNFADSRLRVKGRFVKKEEEHIMRELLDI